MAWLAISDPFLQHTPTWEGQGAPSVLCRGLDAHEHAVGDWKRRWNLTESAAAAHLDMRRPMTLPIAIGLNRREEGLSPSFFKAMSRPPKNQGRTADGIPP